MSNRNYSYETEYAQMTSIYCPFEIKNRFGDTVINPDYFAGYTNEPNYLSSMFTGSFGGFTFSPKFLSAEQSLSDTRFFIDYGDGTIVYNTLSSFHQYTLPGDYNITLVVYNSAGEAFKSNQNTTLRIREVIPDKIFLTSSSNNQNVSEGTVRFFITRYNSANTSRVLSSSNYKIDLSLRGNQSSLVSENDYLTNKNFQYSVSSFFFNSPDSSFKIIDGIETSSGDIYAEYINKEIKFSHSPTIQNTFVGTSGHGEFRVYEPTTTKTN